MKVLVVGSDGVIGTELGKKLKEKYDVFEADRTKNWRDNYFLVDITQYQTLNKAFEVKPDVVFHLAGEVGRLNCEERPIVTIENNVIGTLNVIQHCLNVGAKLIYAGTSESYGDLFNGNKIDEKYIDTKVSHNTIYGLSKFQGEQLIEYYVQRYGLQAVILRYFMCYGNEKPSKYRSAMSQFIKNALLDEPLFVHGNTSRSWCHIDDTVSGTITAAGSAVFDYFNIGNEAEINTLALAEKIIEFCNSKSKIVKITVPDDIYPQKKVSFEKMRSVFNWKAHVGIDEGIKREIACQKSLLALE